MSICTAGLTAIGATFDDRGVSTPDLDVAKTATRWNEGLIAWMDGGPGPRPNWFDVCFSDPRKRYRLACRAVRRVRRDPPENLDEQLLEQDAHEIVNGPARRDSWWSIAIQEAVRAEGYRRAGMRARARRHLGRSAMMRIKARGVLP